MDFIEGTCGVLTRNCPIYSYYWDSITCLSTVSIEYACSVTQMKLDRILDRPFCALLKNSNPRYTTASGSKILSIRFFIKHYIDTAAST